MIQESDVWAVIHKIESSLKKDDVKSIGRSELERIVLDVYDMLGAIVM